MKFQFYKFGLFAGLEIIDLILKCGQLLISHNDAHNLKLLLEHANIPPVEPSRGRYIELYKELYKMDNSTLDLVQQKFNAANIDVRLWIKVYLFILFNSVIIAMSLSSFSFAFCVLLFLLITFLVYNS